ASYNGYKVYWEEGAQITPPHDGGIITEVQAVASYAECLTMDETAAREAGLLITIGKDLDDAYMQALHKCVKEPAAVARYASEIKIVYTPLHGAGNKSVRRILGELGFTHVTVVPEQEKPDGDFPTVPYPNPEAAEAFALALSLARKQDADLVLATDPDSDRLGVYVRDTEGEYHCLTGNVSGALIGRYEIDRLAAKEPLPEGAALISTIVTGKLGRAIADDYKIRYIEVLTGFKYIGEQIKLMEETEHGAYLFGYEESYGCLIGTYARDKDAVSACLALCEAAAYYRGCGMTLWDAVVEMYEKYGYYKDGIKTLSFSGYEGMQQMAAIMDRLRKDNPEKLGDLQVFAKRDYMNHTRVDMLTGAVEKIDLPASDVILFELPDDAWCCIRPSGTEPKIKFYYGIKGNSFADAEKKELEMAKIIDKLAEG
ncbi:MAG: phospho-sugar mutase, partial [Lachnospiraceae bacterium]|nr:phospho-sugar mutase [Candidatus Minthocola equi]